MNMHDRSLADDLPTLAIGEDFSDLREGVRRLCAGFPGEYWRKNEEAAGYPTEFVNALTQAGYLAALQVPAGSLSWTFLQAACAGQILQAWAEAGGALVSEARA